jgi:hypothetical protein
MHIKRLKRKKKKEGEYALLKTFSDIMVENRCICGKSKTS